MEQQSVIPVLLTIFAVDTAILAESLEFLLLALEEVKSLGLESRFRGSA